MYRAALLACALTCAAFLVPVCIALADALLTLVA